MLPRFVVKRFLFSSWYQGGFRSLIVAVPGDFINVFILTGACFGNQKCPETNNQRILSPA